MLGRLTGGLVIAFAVVVPSALGCECGTPEPKQAFQSSQAVFVGEPVSSEGYGLTQVRVVEAFRGARAGDIVPVLWSDGTHCAYRGLEDDSAHHLLFGYWHDGRVHVSQCSRSRFARDAECDLRMLRRRSWWWRLPVSRISAPWARYHDPCPRLSR
jgi:hypothetical protein